MRTRGWAAVAAILAVALVATGCSKKEETAKVITVAGQKMNDKGTKDVSGSASAELELNNEGKVYYFEPTILKGSAGEKVTLDLSNEGDTLHNFSLTDQGVDTDVQPGSKASVTVTFPQSGTLVFFCKYHATSFNMRGALEVG
jgi:plastocyanin